MPDDLDTYTHTAWAANAGMQGRVLSIAQTADGYLWLGTEFGLVRFDGVSFVPIEPGAESPIGGRISSVLAAHDGSLWIGSVTGLRSWRGGQFTEYPELSGDTFMSLLEDHAGTIWAGGRNGLCAIRLARIQCEQIENRDGPGGSSSPFGTRVSSLFEDNDGRLWAGTFSGLWQWRPGPPHLYDARRISVQQALAQGEQGKGVIALAGGQERALLQISPAGMAPYQIPGVPSLLNAVAVLRDHHGTLWIGTNDQGLWRVQNGTVTHFSQEDGLSGNDITALFEDREGSVWVGTINGLDRFHQSAVSTISTDQGLSAPVGCLLAARDGSVWIGTFQGLNQWRQGQMTRYRATAPLSPNAAQAHKDGLERNAVREISDPGLPDNAVDTLFEDRRGRLWVGTNHGVAWFENGKFTTVKGTPPGAPTSIFADAQDGVWISFPALGIYHVLNGGVDKSLPWPWPSQKRDLRVSTVLPDLMTGGVWVGFWDGGISLIEEGKTPTSLTRKDGLGAGTVWNLHFDNESTLWAATDGGLSRIRDGRITTLTTKNGLPCDSAHWMIEDDASLWLNTACGLLRIARSELNDWVANSERTIHPRVFDRSDGLQIQAFSDFTPLVSRAVDGRFWYAQSRSISSIDPLHLPINPIRPPVHIEQVIADGKTYLPVSGLRLPPRLRDLAIDYTALSLVAPEKVRFRYKLEGQDDSWREVINIRRVQYSNLTPATYHFRVIASNNSGVWNEQGATLDFSIAPTYWQTMWFRACCFVAVLIILWMLYQLRLRQIAKGFNARMEERVGERTRIARDLHDTLLQSFQGLLLHFQSARDLLQTHPAEATKALESAIDQTARAITAGREAVQGLRSSTIETNDLATAIKGLRGELAAEAKPATSMEFDVQVEGTLRTLHPIVRDEIYRIAGEALRNAFRHAAAKRIEVEIRYDEWQFRLRIRDDGVGIDPRFLTPEGRPGHFGIHGMRERAKLMGGKLTVWSASESGTEIEFIVPATRAYTTAPRHFSFADKLFGHDSDRRL